MTTRLKSQSPAAQKDTLAPQDQAKAIRKVNRLARMYLAAELPATRTAEQAGRIVSEIEQLRQVESLAAAAPLLKAVVEVVASDPLTPAHLREIATDALRDQES